jgi:hypothetical protein
MDEPKEWNNGWPVEKLDKGWIWITKTMDEHKGFDLWMILRNGTNWWAQKVRQLKTPIKWDNG